MSLLTARVPELRTPSLRFPARSATGGSRCARGRLRGGVAQAPPAADNDQIEESHAS